MAGCGIGFGRSVIVAAAAWWLVSSAPSLANDDIWDTAASGVWQTGSNWLDNTAPAGGDEATFNLAGAYAVTFDGTPPAIQDLTLGDGANVTFTSIGALATQVGTLNVNSASGSGDVSLFSGSILSLGTSGGGLLPNKPLHLTVGDVLLVSSGSTLNVRFGSDVVTSDLLSFGQVNVSGSGSTLNASSETNINFGSLNMTAGGLVQTVVASIDGGVGAVSGAGSQWMNSSTIFVGREGEGTLNITAGGKVQSLEGAVGQSTGGDGDVTVSGVDSQWNNLSNLIVGGEGSGTLNVTGGGSVSSTNGFIGADIGSDGTATFTGGAWTTGRLSVGGNAFVGVAGGFGTLNIQPAGTVSAAQGVVIFPQGLVRLQGGSLDASAVSFEGAGGQFQWTSGPLHVGTFNGNLVNSGGTLAPGHSPGSTTVMGNYTQQSGGALEIEIGGPLAGSEFDFVNVTNAAQIDGELDLTLTGGFVPAPAQTFAILISGSLSGGFDNAASGQRVTTSDGGGSFLVNYGFGSPFEDNQVILSAFQPAGAFTADFDEDGDVDVHDLTQWEGDFGVNDLSDADNDGDSDGADFLAWQQQLGSVPAAPAAGTVPEPTSRLLLWMAIVISLPSLSRLSPDSSHGVNGRRSMARGLRPKKAVEGP